MLSPEVMAEAEAMRSVFGDMIVAWHRELSPSARAAVGPADLARLRDQMAAMVLEGIVDHANNS